MNAYVRTSVVALAAGFVFATLSVSPSAARQPQALLLPPQHDHGLPTFGFSSFNVGGVGERVTHVRWGGLAARMGLEPGDLILNVNGYPLHYQGSWNDALHRAMSQGGFVRLRIRDVRTGFIAFREMYVGGGMGPITPKSNYIGNYGPNGPYWNEYNEDFNSPNGPVTAKSKRGPNHGSRVEFNLKQIAKHFED
jgi:hypothetical protein